MIILPLFLPFEDEPQGCMINYASMEKDNIYHDICFKSYITMLL